MNQLEHDICRIVQNKECKTIKDVHGYINALYFTKVPLGAIQTAIKDLIEMNRIKKKKTEGVYITL